MSDIIKLALRPNGEAMELQVQVRHPMDAGDPGTEKSVKARAANFLKTIAIQLNEKLLVEGQMGPGMAKDPVLRFSLRAVKAGDKLSVVCTDNKDKAFEADIVYQPEARKGQ